MRIIFILLLCFIFINLFIGLFHMLRDRSGSNKTVRALTIRVGLSVLLFVFIIVSSQFGLFPK
ncbi:twin transmembrane helix small protein [Candidatus Persebacteraceae bacterium Df01]|jgi:succinate dehydrogenase hydrophobic anchor subunit|uniref:Twin transmembrane helix small protein n=1 Tax=Candidatus Doriopsillibacter californiensis TaxID=2970740 RepID=A0ABT7QJU7_9GAMM|nr:twin transmembrane helix small protein [Candidatus Persebacteraceae bacterium Df01]